MTPPFILEPLRLARQGGRGGGVRWPTRSWQC